MHIDNNKHVISNAQMQKVIARFDIRLGELETKVKQLQEKLDDKNQSIFSS